MESVPSLKPFVALLMMVVFSVGLKTSGVHVTKGQIPGKPVRNDFWCPTCRNTTRESCDAALTNTTCPKAEFCIAFSTKNVFARKCVNTKMLERMTNAEGCTKADSTTTECVGRKRYHVAWCDQSGCKATVVKPIIRAFWCPTCQKTTQESCDAALTNTTCPKAEFCIAFSAKNVFARKCVNTKMLERMTNAEGCTKADSTTTECVGKKRYHVAWCDQSGCKATVVKPTIRAFWCPTCQKTTQESCDAALTNTTCPKAEFCIAFSAKNVFARKCVNTKMLERMTNAEGCRKVDSTTTKCKRKKRYHVAWCDQSGCKATVVKIKADHVPGIPKGSERGIDDPPFRCPTCNKCKSPQECDTKLKMINCPKATRCLALRVNGTTESENMFARKCINEKSHELIQKACAKKKGCEMSTCSHSGCKAAL